MSGTQDPTAVELRWLDGGRFGVEAGRVLPGPVALGPEGEAGGRVVVRSGWPAAGLGEDEAAAWRVRAGGGMKAFEEALGPLAAACAERGRRLCVRPRAADVLSDVPSTLSLLRRRESDGLEVLCAPADLITEGMLRHAGDHYLRALSGLTGHPRVVGVLLEDVTAGPGGGAAACAPGAGLLPPAVWAAAFELVRAGGVGLVGSALATGERLRALGWTGSER